VTLCHFCPSYCSCRVVALCHFCPSLPSGGALPLLPQLLSARLKLLESSTLCWRWRVLQTTHLPLVSTCLSTSISSSKSKHKVLQRAMCAAVLLDPSSDGQLQFSQAIACTRWPTLHAHVTLTRVKATPPPRAMTSLCPTSSASTGSCQTFRFCCTANNIDRETISDSGLSTPIAYDS